MGQHNMGRTGQVLTSRAAPTRRHKKRGQNNSPHVSLSTDLGQAPHDSSHIADHLQRQHNGGSVSYTALIQSLSNKSKVQGS
jgi:hypothetical protein